MTSEDDEPMELRGKHQAIDRRCAVAFLTTAAAVGAPFASHAKQEAPTSATGREAIVMERMLHTHYIMHSHWHEFTQLIFSGLVAEPDPEKIALFRKADSEIGSSLRLIEREIKGLGQLSPLRRLQVTNVFASFSHIKDSTGHVLSRLEAGDGVSAHEAYQASAVPLYTTTLKALETFRLSSQKAITQLNSN